MSALFSALGLTVLGLALWGFGRWFLSRPAYIDKVVDAIKRGRLNRNMDREEILRGQVKAARVVVALGMGMTALALCLALLSLIALI